MHNHTTARSFRTSISPIRCGAAVRGVVVITASVLGVLGVVGGGAAALFSHQSTTAAWAARDSETQRADEMAAKAKDLEAKSKQLIEERGAFDEKLAKQAETLTSVQRANELAAERQMQLESSFQAMRNDLDRVNGQAIKDKSDLTDAKARITTLEGELANAQAQVVALTKAKSDSMTGAQSAATKIQQELAKAKSGRHGAKAAEKNTTDKLAQMQAKIDADQKMIHDLTAQLERQRTPAPAAPQNQPQPNKPAPAKKKY